MCFSFHTLTGVFCIIMLSLLHLRLSLSPQRSLEGVMKFSMTAVQSPTLMLPLWWHYEEGPCFTLSTSSSPVCSSPPWPWWSSCSPPTRGRRSAWVRNNMSRVEKRRTGVIDDVIIRKVEKIWDMENKRCICYEITYVLMHILYSFLVKPWAYFTLLVFLLQSSVHLLYNPMFLC